MIKNVCKSGLQTLALPSYNNKPQDYVGIIINVATCLEIEKDHEINTILLAYSPSHLIEHTIPIQNDNLFIKLRKESKCQLMNAMTSIPKTSYYFQIKSENLSTTLPIILNSIYNIKLDEKIYKAEQDVIDHEFYNRKLENINNKDLILNSKELQDAEAKVEDEAKLKYQELLEQLKRSLMNQNLSPNFLQDYYNKNYLPENSIIAITNCDKKTYDAFKNVVNNFFGTKVSEPIIHDLKDYKEIINGEYTDELIDSIFEAKYTIFEFKDRLTDRSKYEFFFKFPNENNKHITVAEFYEYMFTKPDRVSFNEKNMINILRTKRHLVYTPTSTIDNLNSQEKNILSLTVNSSCINTHKAMTGVRSLINKIAFNNYITSDDFNYNKKKFKEFYLSNKYYDNNVMTILDYNTLSLFSGDKHCDIIKDIKKIDEIRYEDFINFAKYVAKTENYSIIAYGNFIKPSDLEAFELKNKLTYNDRDSERFTGEKNVCAVNRNTFLIAKETQPKPEKDNSVKGSKTQPQPNKSDNNEQKQTKPAENEKNQ